MASPSHVMTVLGPVAPEELGPTLTHEHLVTDLRCYCPEPAEATLAAVAGAKVELSNLGLLRRNPVLMRDNCLLNDLDLAIEEVLEFRKLGGGTIVDVTLPDIGRDPLALQVASRMSGVNLVAGCGHYVHFAHPPELDDEPLEAVAERLVGELTDGIGSSGVRPGVIGEIGTTDPLHPNEEKVLRAAARASAATGVAITLHLFPSRRKGHEILEILESEGADPARVVMGHLDLTLGHRDAGFDEVVSYHRSLAERGCFVQYDTCGKEYCYSSQPGSDTSFWCPSDRERARAVAALVEAGVADRILLSHDVCHKFDLVRYGGFGYGHILRSFVQNLRDFGLGMAEIDQFLVENPRRMLAVAA